MANALNDTITNADSGIAINATDTANRQSDTPAVLSFRDQVSELVAPYRTSTTRPPFTTGELIVIALVLIDEDIDSVSDLDIHLWIISVFRFYKGKALQQYAFSMLAIRDGESQKPDEVVPDFSYAIRDCDLPIQSDNGLYRCSVTESAARLYLDRWLAPERKGKFRFLDLPAELRNRIYEMLFRFPSPGIGTGIGQPGKSTLCLLSRTSSREASGIFHYQKVSRAPLPSALTMLQTNKQVFKEAMPMLYSLNSFIFDSTVELKNALVNLPADRAKHLKHINLGLWTSGSEGFWGASQAFLRLAKLSLDVLILRMPLSTERGWLKCFSQRHRNYNGKKWEECTGFKTYFQNLIKAAKKAKRFEIHGNCPEFKAYMASKVKVSEPVDVKEK